MTHVPFARWRLPAALALVCAAPHALAECGDGRWQSSLEECDDGNTADGDGCSASCTIEAGYTCANAPDLNTGSTADGGQASVGTDDRIWRWGPTLNAAGQAAKVAGNCATGFWQGEPSNARWINRHGCSQSTPEDTTTFYSATFELASAEAAAATYIDGTFWADNSVKDVYVNGVSTGVAFGPIGYNGRGVKFGDWPSALYKTGTNTIAIEVYNAEGAGLNPDGLLISIPNAFGGGSTCDQTCGDDHVDSWEECDDGNNVDGDGCAANCRAEDEDRDGDGFTVGEGDCDDNNDEVNPSASEVCADAIDNDCDGDIDEGCDGPVCGDGYHTWGAEECDDGNTVSGDGCDDTCALETGYCATVFNLNTGVTADGQIAAAGTDDLVWTWSETLDGAESPATVQGTCGYATEITSDRATYIGRGTCEEGAPAASSTFFTARFDLTAAQLAQDPVLMGEANAYFSLMGATLNGNSIVAVAPNFDLADLPSSAFVEGENELTFEVFAYVSGGFDGDMGLIVNAPGGLGGPANTCGSEPICGDDNLDAGEECDDGNTADGDGCSADCLIEQDDADGDGFGAHEDCDDTNPAINPAALETCNEIDDNCNDLVDDDPVDGDGQLYSPDRDLDGFGSPIPVGACGPGPGLIPYNDAGLAFDCDDTDADVNPDAQEVCDDDDTDEDCDSTADDFDPDATGKTTWYVDEDFDGYGGNIGQQSCDSPGVGFSATNDDCDDTDDSRNPGATDIPNDGIDQDCDGEDATGEDTDTDTDTSDCADADEDGFADAACGGDDCDDANDAVNPEAEEISDNGIDENCSGADQTEWFQGGCSTSGGGSPGLLGGLLVVLGLRRKGVRS